MTVLDQEKAFDRKDWNFILKALQHVGYRPEIIQKIKNSLSKQKHKSR